MFMYPPLCTMNDSVFKTVVKTERPNGEELQNDITNQSNSQDNPSSIYLQPKEECSENSFEEDKQQEECEQPFQVLLPHIKVEVEEDDDKDLEKLTVEEHSIYEEDDAQPVADPATAVREAASIIEGESSTTNIPTTTGQSGNGETGYNTLPKSSESVCGVPGERSTKRFVCECGKVFPRPFHLKRHQLIHSGPFVCTHCSIPFKAIKYLRSHEAIHSKEKHSTCQPTLSTSPTAEDPGGEATEPNTESMDSVTSGKNVKTFMCECGKTFPRPFHLKRHQLIHSGPFACDQCGISFKAIKYLRRHKLIHTTTKQHSCDGTASPAENPGDEAKTDGGTKPKRFVCECGKAFPRSFHLRRHQLTHSDARPFACTLCGMAFKERSNLRSHALTHSTHKRFACATCGKTFQRRDHLEEHALAHGGRKAFACDVCAATFVCPRYLKEHKRIHSRERLHCCELCGKTFLYGSYLKIHRALHSGTKAHVCTQCGKTFSARSSLLTHLRVHRGERPFACEQCGKRFVLRSALQQHMRTHSGERPFSCVVCGASFACSSNMRTHMRVHTGERPYACETCGKSFTEAATLRHHRRVHTGEKPFVCKVCDVAYAHPFSLRQHNKKHAAHAARKAETAKVTGTLRGLPLE